MKSIFRPLRWTATALLLTAALSGCASEDGFTVDALGPDMADAATTGLFAPPALSDLRGRLNLTPEQAAKVETLLEDWNADAAERPRPEGRRNKGHGMRRGGPDGARRGGGPGHGPGLDRGEPPQVAFLIGIIEILDTPQIEQLGAFMKERRGEAFERMAGKGPRGRGDRPDFREKMAERLGLSETQRDEMQAAMKTYREGLRTLRDQFEIDAISAENFRDQAKALRATMETTVRARIGDDTFEKIQERRREMRGARGERHGGTDRHADRMLDMLTKGLKLDASQQGQIRAILDSRKPQAEAIQGRVKEGTLEPEDALYEAHKLREEGRAAIKTVLNADQRARFEALQSLLPGGGHGRRK